MSHNSFALVYDLPVTNKGEQYTIVLTKWLYEKENTMYLSYPGAKEYHKALRLKKNVDKLWSVSSVVVVGYYDTFEAAKEKESRMIQYQSSSETDTENPNNSKSSLRKTVHPLRKNDFLYEEDSLSPLPQPSSQVTSDIDPVQIEDIPMVIIPSTNIADDINSIHLNSEAESTSTNEVHNLLQNIYEKLIKFDVILQSHTDRLISIERKLNITPTNNNEVPILTLQLPIRTIDELQEFEENLNEPQSAALFHVLRRISASNERTTIFKMLSKIFDHELATICSWKGRKSNHKIEHLKLIKVVIDAVRDSYPTIKDLVVEQAGIDWFRSAQQRLSRLKKLV